MGDLKAWGLWNDEVIEKLKYYEGSIQRINEIPEEIRERFKEVFEIDAHWIVRHAARRAKWIDQSQSVNIFTSSESGTYISDVYFDAWRSGMKTTYYLRILAASAIEKSTIDINKNYETPSVETETSFAEAKPEVVLASAHVIDIATDGLCESCQ